MSGRSRAGFRVAIVVAGDVDGAVESREALWRVARFRRDLDRFRIALSDIVGNNGIDAAGSVYCWETRGPSMERSAV